MSKSRFKKWLGICLLAIPVLVCFFAFSFNKENVEAEDVLQEEYQLYTTVEIPDRDIAYSDGTTPATEYSLEYPNGVIKEGKIHNLDIPGQYTVHYATTVGDKYIQAKDGFLVPNMLISPRERNTNTTISYGINEQYPTLSEGLVVSLASGDALEFNQTINLKNMTRLDRLLAFYVTPISYGTYDATRLRFRFTDIYDENNWLEVTYKCVYNVRPWAFNTCYIEAQTTGNPTLGGGFLGSDIYGYPVYNSFCGQVSTFDLKYDNETKSVWTSQSVGLEPYHGAPIADLDDMSFFTRPWEGFTTGEVKLSVYATSYNGPSFNFVLTELAGYDLTERTLYDVNAPTISIDMAGNEEIPVGKKNVPYKVFESTAFDDYTDNVSVETNVYFKYGKPGQISYSLQNGEFLPNYAGTYTIEYKAKDHFGNVAVETKDVTILNDAESLDFEILNPLAQGVAGEQNKMFDGVDIVNAKGGTKVKAVVSCQGEKVALDQNYALLPLKVGTYTIEIVVSDYIESVTKSFDVEIKANELPIFVEEATIVDYFISGQTYHLSAYNGYDLSSGEAKELKARTFIIEDKGDKKEVATDAFTVTAKETVQVVFEIANENGAAEKIYEIPVIDAIMEDGCLDITQYFKVTVGSGTVVATDDYVSFATNQNSTFKFANAVQMEEFHTRFKWGEKQAFGGVNLYFTDSIDESVRIKVTYTWVDGIGYIAINDGKVTPVPVSKTSTDNSRLLLWYDNDAKQIYGDVTRKLDVLQTVYGEEFSGFPSNMAYVEYEMFDVTGESELYLLRINNQQMYDLQSGDLTEAELFMKRANGNVGLGAKVSIYGIRAYDVLSSSVALTIKVLDPIGNFVTATDGTILNGQCDPKKDYEIVVDQYAIYKVICTATDGAENVYTFSYGFTCVDMQAPTVRLNTSNASAKVGSNVKIRNIKVSDDSSSSKNISVSVYVLTPSYQMQLVDDQEFKAKEKGVYKVYYYVTDEAGNMTVAQYSVVVS